jgi:hypothetical protein
MIKTNVVHVLNWLTLCHGDMGNEGIVPPFLTMALDGGEWSPSLSTCFTCSTDWIGG